jgi:hypothetical protein
MTYLFTREVAKKRLAGIVAAAVLLSSTTFLQNDTLASYDNSWILFYLVSLYLMIKKWYFSVSSFAASMLSKPLTIAYLPLSIVLAFFSELPKKQKFLTIAAYSAIMAMVVLLREDIAFLRVDLEALAGSLWLLPNQLEGETLFKLLTLPALVGLYLADRRGAAYAKPVAVILAGTILSFFFLEGFTGITAQSYRVISIMVFFAVAVGAALARGSSNHKHSVWRSLAVFTPSFLVTLFVWGATLYPNDVYELATRLKDAI